jgi:hypothetical protein
MDDLVDAVSEAEQFSAVHGRGATDLRRSWRRHWLDDFTGRFCFIETQGIDKLLQEERDAVI